MTVAQSIAVTVKRVKQSGLGVPGSAGSQLMRRVTLTLNKQSTVYSSNEIVSHQQSTGATQGPSAINGSLSGELSPASYELEMAALCRRDFTAAFTAITAVSLTIAGAGPTYTVTRAAGSFLTDGVKKGHIIQLSVGALNAANSSNNLLVTAVTATVLTVAPLAAANALVAEGPITGCTVSAPGKATNPPTTGHTNDYFTWEKFFSDIVKSDLLTDVKPADMTITVPANGIPTVAFTMAGLGRTIGGAEVLTSPSAATTSNVVAGVQGKIVINGAITAVTNVTFKVDGKTTTGDPEVGSSTLSDLQRGKIDVAGSFAAKFSSQTLQTLRDNQSVITFIVSAADSSLPGANFVVFTLPAIKIMTDDADDAADKQVIRTYQFTAQYNGSGGAGTDSVQSILMIQDSLAT